MSGKIRQLHKNRPASDQPEIATVVKAENGAALLVALGAGEPQQVAGHRHDVPALREGDQVLIRHSGSGAVILERLRGNNDPPAPLIRMEDGKLVIEAAQGICLACGDSRIELLKDGQILINGSEINLIAEETLRIQGSSIMVN